MQLLGCHLLPAAQLARSAVLFPTACAESETFVICVGVCVLDKWPVPAEQMPAVPVLGIEAMAGSASVKPVPRDSTAASLQAMRELCGRKPVPLFSQEVTGWLSKESHVWSA